MHILLLSAGGGGGNILRSVKAAFRRDLSVTQRGDARYAERLRRAVTTRFLDTNEFALSDLPKEERFLIGSRTTGRLGARHDPAVALEALSESRNEVEALFSRGDDDILIRRERATRAYLESCGHVPGRPRRRARGDPVVAGG